MKHPSNDPIQALAAELAYEIRCHRRPRESAKLRLDKMPYPAQLRVARLVARAITGRKDI